MAFPEIYKLTTDVGSYIPEDKLNKVIAKILQRINNIVANERVGLTTISVTRKNITITVNLAKELVITVPEGCTSKELLKINKAIKDEVMVVEVPIGEPVLDQSQELVLGQQWNCKEWAPPFQFCPIAQTFTAGMSANLAKFGFVSGTDVGSGTITMQLQATTNGKPNGVVLETMEFNPADLVNDDWTYVPFSTELVSGTKYAFVMSFENYNAGGYGPNINRYNSDTVNAYANGEFLIFVNGTWNTTKDAGFTGPDGQLLYSDLVFRTYMLA